MKTQQLTKLLNWPYGTFELPDDLVETWRNFYKRTASHKSAWDKHNHRLTSSPQYKEFFSKLLGTNVKEVIVKFKDNHFKNQTNCATRKASELSLEIITPLMKNLIGGSADLTGSNNTKTKNMEIISKKKFSGTYIHYGIREHGMVSIMNGMALHGGIKPYGGTFLVFTDYCRPSIRLAALMKLPVIYVMTHDSIGLGEDGPTHQPVEHLASLRAMPNLTVIRPSDIIETMEAWEYALESSTPTVLVLTRQNIPMLRKKNNVNIVQQGAFPIVNHEQYAATILATGSEVEIACESAAILANEKINIRVVSFPSWEIFEKQTDEDKLNILGNKPRFAIEAGVINGWEKYIPSENFIGMKTFGVSGPYKKLYEHFAITSNALAELIKEKMEKN